MNPTDDVREIAPADGLWKARHHGARVDGPSEIICAGDCLARAVSFQVDDFAADLVLSDRFRDFHKGGAAVVEVSGHYPFGAEIGIEQSFRYGARHVRVVSDLRLRSGSTVRRQVDLGSLFLPGPWRRIYCLPPCRDLVDGATGGWLDLPTTPPTTTGVIAQWSHPPLTLVFERPSGARLEVGTGADLWRWERTFGIGSAASCYTILAEPDGLRLRREPLKTDVEVQPRPSLYRLSWYLAWQAADDQPPACPGPEPVPVRFTAQGEALVQDAAAGAAVPRLLLDLAQWPCLAQRRRAAAPAALRRGERSPCPCWESAGVQKALHRMIRQVAALGPRGVLTWRGLYPGLCWDPAHCERQGEPLPHWDADALLGLGTWGRQQLGPGWQVQVEAPGWEMLPSMTGLFAPTGFAAPADETPDA